VPHDAALDALQASLGAAYSLDRELGGGAMSRVFVATETALGRQVVVKMLTPELADGLSTERFAREIRLGARLQEPHIVPLLAAGVTADGLPWYTMPFVAGESLRRRLERQPPPALGEVVGVLRDVARALAYAHERGVVHRDVKPENVLLSSGTAVVTDFGIAKAIGEAAMRSTASAVFPWTLTGVGTSIGTPAYMAPEQAAGDPVDHRADIYAWGVVAYELLAGCHPFAGRSSAQQLIAANIAEEPPPLPTAHRSSPGAKRTGGVGAVPPALAALVSRCLAKDPAQRPASAAEIIAALDAAAEGGGGGHGRPLVRALRRGGAIAAGTLATTIVLALSAGWRPGHPSPGSAAGGALRSVGVVPFESLGASRENDYLSEGITEEIADALGKVPQLRVAVERARASGARDARDAREVGHALGVDAVLEGTVQRNGDRVRITARLVSVADGFQLWSEKYDRQLRDAFELQDDLAKAIVVGMRVRIAGGGRSLVREATTSPDAHLHYLQGMYYWNRRSVATLRQSITYFRRAIDEDPPYAEPHAGLALEYALIAENYGRLDPMEMSDSALAVATRALALDSTSADAWTAMGYAHEARWENRKSLEDFSRAIALDPNNARARQWYAEELAHVGRIDDALREVKRAQELEPLTVIINANVGRVQLYARQYREAEATLRHAIELDSSRVTAHILLASALASQGRTEEALAEANTARTLRGEPSSSLLGVIGYIEATSGRTADAEAIVRQIEARRAAGLRISYGELAPLLFALGRHGAALAALDTAVARHDADLKLGSRTLEYDGLRRDPRGAELLEMAEGLH
jgi:serine/threonine-protein kinase